MAAEKQALKIWREPFVHFWLIGGVAFLLHLMLDGSEPPGRVIVLTPEFRAELARDGTEEQYIADEVLYRQALERGLDRGDALVRRRLVQKMRFILQGELTLEVPGDEDLEVWVHDRPEAFRTPERRRFRHRFFDRDKRAAAGADAAAALAAGNMDKPGDVFHGHTGGLMTRQALTKLLGPEFAAAVFRLEPGRWSGPLTSARGSHLVYVEEVRPGEMPPFAAVRSRAREQWLREAEAEGLRRATLDLRRKYRVDRPEKPMEAGL